MERIKDVLIDSILKQGFSVILLMLGLYYFHNEVRLLKVQVEQLQKSLIECITSKSKN